MILAITSGDVKTDYIVYRLKDHGVVNIEIKDRIPSKTSKYRLLVLCKDVYRKDEIEKIKSFLNNNGDIISLYPSKNLLKLVGEYEKKIKFSKKEIDWLNIWEYKIPLLADIVKIKSKCNKKLTINKKIPWLITNKSKNNLYCFTFEASKLIHDLEQGPAIVYEKIVSDKEHGEFNILENIFGSVNFNTPYCDILIWYVREIIIKSFIKENIALPFVWYYPDKKTNAAIVSIDQDWAGGYLIKNILNLMEKHSISASIFLTNPLKDKNLNKKLNKYDIQPHPFLKDSKKSGYFFEESKIKSTLNSLNKKPDGIRYHCRLIKKPEMIDLAKKYRIKWDSNYGVGKSIGYTQGTGVPYFLFNKNNKSELLEMPINFEDDTYVFDYDAKFEKKEIKDLIDNSKNKFFSCLMFDFHPVHVFINLKSWEQYKGFKELNILNNKKKLRAYKKNKGKGILKLFLFLLRYLNKNKKDVWITTGSKMNEFWQKRNKVRISFKNNKAYLANKFKGLTIAVPILNTRQNIFIKKIKIGDIDYFLREENGS